MLITKEFPLEVLVKVFEGYTTQSSVRLNGEVRLASTDSGEVTLIPKLSQVNNGSCKKNLRKVKLCAS